MLRHLRTLPLAAALMGFAALPATAQNLALRDVAALRLTSLVFQNEGSRAACGVTREQEQGFQTRIAMTLTSGGIRVPIASNLRDGGDGNMIFSSDRPDPTQPHLIVTAMVLQAGQAPNVVCSLSVLARLQVAVAPGATVATGTPLPPNVSIWTNDRAEIGLAAAMPSSILSSATAVATALLEERRTALGQR